MSLQPVDEHPVESTFTFECAGEQLPAILHAGDAAARRGVLVVVGGPQTRVGSHRQFVLLARDLAAAGFPTLRFDYRGMGDGEGEARDFTAIDADIHAALDAFQQHCPQLQEFVIWGLCDAASAALFHAWRDERISGLVLLNPWVRTEAGEAKAYLTHYYRDRLLSPALWKKILHGEFEVIASLRSLLGFIGRLRRRPQALAAAAGADPTAALPLPDRMAECLRRFRGRVLLVLAGNDLTAAEFCNLTNGSEAWTSLLDEPRVVRRALVEANHTFSSRQWRNEVSAWTADWLRSW